MCWNWQVSLGTWFVGLLTALYLFHRRNKYDLTIGSLILIYSSMQLWEALMWFDQKCGKLNRIANYMAYLALWSHTLAIGVGLYLENITKIPLYIGLVFMGIAIIYFFFIKWKCSKPGKGGCGHLVWGFPHKYYVLVFSVCIILCFLYIKPLWKACIISGIFILSFLLSFLYAKNATGSFWCWVAATFAPIFILINKK